GSGGRVAERRGRLRALAVVGAGDAAAGDEIAAGRGAGAGGAGGVALNGDALAAEADGASRARRTGQRGERGGPRSAATVSEGAQSALPMMVVSSSQLGTDEGHVDGPLFTHVVTQR